MNAIEKLRYHFDAMVVYKDLQKSSFFGTLNLPSFMRDWVLKKFQDESGDFDVDSMKSYVSKYIPSKDDWLSVKDKLTQEGETVKILAKIHVDIDVNSGEITFTLPDYGLEKGETTVDASDWAGFKEHLLGGAETWGLLKLGYVPPQEKPRRHGKIKLLDFKNFQPYEVDVDYYREARKEFTIAEWIDVLLGAVDYNADGYQNEENKLALLTRLLPFVEPRLNLIELAPKGTGKSYLYGRVSRYGWLSNGGIMTRAQLFYDLSRSTEGLIANNDFVVLDEVQTIKFGDVDELGGALKGYLEQGVYKVGKHENRADAGMILSGNIPQSIMDGDGYKDMFSDLPYPFKESALIDRFHGFLKGWKIPRMTDGMKISNWALNSEYFSSIMHELRREPDYARIVEELVKPIDVNADIRDMTAIRKLTTAYLKLLFPHVREASDVKPREFNRYCLRPACEMRAIIRYQLGLLDSEYRGKSIPEVQIDEERCGNDFD